MLTVTVQANFSYQANFGTKGPVAYETLFWVLCVAMQRSSRVETK